MDFFGFANNDLVSPIGIQIRSATDPLLLQADWSKNLDICDLLNNDPVEISAQAARVIIRRLQESDPKIVELSLILADSCIQNTNDKFTSAVDKTFLDEVIHVSKGSKGKQNADDSLRLIQEWGRKYEGKRNRFPLFFDTYVALKARGARFPPEDFNNLNSGITSSATS